MTVAGEVIDIANGKADMMSHIKESNEDGAAISPTDGEEPGPSITTTEAENRVIDDVLGTPHAELRSGTHDNKDHIQKYLDLLTMRFMCLTGSTKEALKDADWIMAMQEELHPFERNSVWHLVPRPADRTIIGTRWVFRNKLDEIGNTTRNKAPCAWYEKLSKFLLENGFTRGNIDNTLFMKKRERNLLIVQVYVDVIIFGATNDSV
ncbi:PREDICTED: uncharacterized protein LOC109212064 [Nicotiana attenuata]|uniref:uncharacterized protein LOC109212064 n=1 Tax=Nicotiana attenuata TaxID=49451 RepID=UPI0009051D3D|nr:PREDICTED: uncharacterized protein LOC109212064 [Nicotiana attenuata]